MTDNHANHGTSNIGKFYISQKSLSINSQMRETEQQDIIKEVQLSLLAGTLQLDPQMISKIKPNSILLLDQFVEMTDNNLNNVILQNGSQQYILNMDINNNDMSLQKATLVS